MKKLCDILGSWKLGIAKDSCTQAEIDRKSCRRFETVFHFRFRKKQLVFHSEFANFRLKFLMICNMYL